MRRRDFDQSLLTSAATSERTVPGGAVERRRISTAGPMLSEPGSQTTGRRRYGRLRSSRGRETHSKILRLTEPDTEISLRVSSRRLLPTSLSILRVSQEAVLVYHAPNESERTVPGGAVGRRRVSTAEGCFPRLGHGRRVVTATDDFVAVEVTRLILKPSGWRHRTSKSRSESPYVDCYQRSGHVAVEVTRLILNPAAGGTRHRNFVQSLLTSTATNGTAT